MQPQAGATYTAALLTTLSERIHIRSDQKVGQDSIYSMGLLGKLDTSLGRVIHGRLRLQIRGLRTVNLNLNLNLNLNSENGRTDDAVA